MIDHKLKVIIKENNALPNNLSKKEKEDVLATYFAAKKQMNALKS